MDLLITLGFSLILNTVLFLVAYNQKTDKLTDMAYALSFVGIAVFGYLRSNQTVAQLLIAAFVLTWAFRLGSYLVVRIHVMGRDKRFDAMRESFWSFGRFWLLQAVTAWIVMLATSLFFESSGRVISTTIFYVGLGVAITGLIIEAIADQQKFEFIKSKEKGFISTGLWKYSRHPNYFGEIVVWLGVYIAVVQSLTGLQVFIALVSPLFIMTLLLFVSGIPLLEKSADKKFAGDKAYQAYKRRTSVLLPWPPAK